MILAVSFSVLFLMIPSMEFASFTAAALWVNIFIEVSTMTPKVSFLVIHHQAVKMSGSGNYQEFQTVEMRKELEESNKENSDAGSASGPNSTTAPPSASKTMLYPRPYADPYNSRKYFATRPGAFDQAMDDLKAHVMSNMGETAHSFWLLAEVDHWNNEKERVAVITGSALLICKYDFIMLKCLQLQRIPLSYINSVCLGSFTFPERSLDNAPLWGLLVIRPTTMEGPTPTVFQPC
ncbi:tumor protein p63-regulated gene 1 protein-like isoform X2 [Rhineura floridana]|uniref:tumor protein p63-regulated gene 1 protein-like isoform X2 n=2 Tax=Rhineura floridana TaxID=261503 RepID=UPI002AC84D67|nr:tumor protein p63-regulated gene 1 protein-like isoform X2 [Rhineura floridana]